MKPDIQLSLRSTCIRCKHFDPVEGMQQDGGLCRESSPQVTIVLVPQTNLMSRETQMVPNPISAFPQVAGDCWCGQWASKLPVLQRMN